MLFSLIVALMVILIAAFWTYQGMFSAAIMFFEAVIAAMVAFAFYESVHELWANSVGPGIGLPAALLGLFCVTLGALRGLTDRYIEQDVQMPVPVARAGGAIFGFFAGMVMIGMVMIGVQMLPVGSEVFSFERMQYDVERGGPARMSNLGFFSPDRFAYGLVTMLSDGGRFGTDDANSLRRTKADLITQLYSARSGPQSEARVFVPETALKARAWWETDKIDQVKHQLETPESGKLIREFETKEPARVGNKFVVATVFVSNDAAPENRTEVRFRLPQFRLIGFDRGNESEDPAVYLASGMTDIYIHRKYGPFPVSDGQRERLVQFGPFTNFIVSPEATKVVQKENGYEFDVAFEVPGTFKPWYIEFKAGARADLSVMKKSEQPPAWASVAQGAGGVSGVTQLKQQQVATANSWQPDTEMFQVTGFGAALPVPLPADEPEVSRHLTGQLLGKPDGIHAVVTMPDARPEGGITTMYVPDGKVMMQVAFDDPQKKSMWGRAIQFSQRVVADTYVMDNEGNRYDAIGQYAMAKVDGRWTFEIQYWPNADMPERVLKSNKPKKVTQSVLDAAGPDNSFFGFIFVLPDTVTQIKTFHPGPGKPLDLNLFR